MALPMVAIVGRPNVGKSTLFNRLSATKQAIVEETAGVTRDRNYTRTEWRGIEFTLVDTGGIEVAGEEPLIRAIRDQAIEAIEESDLIVFLVDGHSGPTADDAEVAAILRRSRKKVLLVVNKADDPARDDYGYPFFQLGLGESIPVSASQGLGTGDLLDLMVAALPEMEEEERDEHELSVAIVGRPNAGKSSLLNRLLGFERATVGDTPGTTRDAIDTVLTHGGKTYRLIDTAGLRKNSKLSGAIEYYGTLRAIRAIEAADVAVLVVDGEVGITDQDQRIAALAAEKGCGVIFFLNKWDVVDEEAAAEISGQMLRKLQFVDYALVLKGSALTGKGPGRLFAAVETVAESLKAQIPTSQLNKLLAKLRQGHLPSKRGKTLKLKYVTQVAVSPPAFLFFVNDPRLVDNAYRRYVEKAFRKEFDLRGTPLRLYFKRGKED